MNEDLDSSRKQRYLRPGDPAIWVWAAVALIALVPLQHAVASRGERAAARLEQSHSPVAPAQPAAAQSTGKGSATP